MIINANYFECFFPTQVDMGIPEYYKNVKKDALKYINSNIEQIEREMSIHSLGEL